jgi:hypothetical protein
MHLDAGERMRALQAARYLASAKGTPVEAVQRSSGCDGKSEDERHDRVAIADRLPRRLIPRGGACLGSRAGRRNGRHGFVTDSGPQTSPAEAKCAGAASTSASSELPARELRSEQEVEASSVRCLSPRYRTSNLPAL